MHAEQPEAFNAYVKRVCAVVDAGKDLSGPIRTTAGQQTPESNNT